jgi:hypothetical protein
MRSTPALRGNLCISNINVSRVEAVSNTSIVALKVVEGDEKGTQCLGVYPGHPVPERYKYVDWPSRLGNLKSETVNVVMIPA